MATFTDVFERREVKYRLDADARDAMISALRTRMEPDRFGRSCISSIYLDTPDRSLIARSLEKPLYKEKLRVRWYGPADPNGRVFIELKKKFRGIVYKRRVACSRMAASAFLLEGLPYEEACARHPLADAQMQAESLDARSLQIAREISWMMERFHRAGQPLAPSMLITSDRLALAPIAPVPDDTPDTLRVTFDANIRCRDLQAPRSGAAAARTGTRLIGPSEAIMELKAPGTLPLWLVDALDASSARPCSFSKYGQAYELCCERTAPHVPRAAAQRCQSAAPARHPAARAQRAVAPHHQPAHLRPASIKR